jgi:hypothetical protein
MLLAHRALPSFLPGLNWTQNGLIPLSPVLLADEVSWAFSMALVTVGLGMVLTAVARIERPPKADTEQSESDLGIQAGRLHDTNWRVWAGSMLMVGMGLVAILSGNLLTILLAWAAIDIVELLVLLADIHDSRGRELLVIGFSSRLVGIIILIIAEIFIWQAGGIFSISSVHPQIAIYLLLAAGLRLGVIPLHIPFLQEIRLRRSLGTILRMVSAAASLSLLVRAASIGLSGSAAILIFSLTALAALYGAGMWFFTSDELAGRPFWILGTAAFAIAAAIQAQPAASLAWGVASLYAGGLLFFASLRNRRLNILFIAGFISLTALPFTPTWSGAMIYSLDTGQLAIPAWTSVIFSTCFLIAHGLLLAGFLRHSFRQSQISGEITRDPTIERWIWLIYPLGLAILPLTQFLTSLWTMPDLAASSPRTIVASLTATGLGVGFWYYFTHKKPILPASRTIIVESISSEAFSLTWLYRPLWVIYKLLSRLSSLVQTILEGEGGILWAVVLFFLILTFLRR